MSYMSATEMLSSLSLTNKIPEFEKTNTILYREPQINYDRKLSPWFAKRRLSKTIKSQKKVQDKQITSQKTQEFLRKIFPQKCKKNPQESLRMETSDRTVTTQQQTQQQQSSFIFLPIKPINFEKLSLKKALLKTQTKQKQEQQKICINKIQSIPQENLNPIAQFSHRIMEIPKASPMVLTFRKSFKKKEKLKTQIIQRKSHKKQISLDEIYTLIGRQPTKTTKYFTNQINFSVDTKQLDQPQKSNNWLIPRSIKNNKNYKLKEYICKTQYI